MVTTTARAPQTKKAETNGRKRPDAQSTQAGLLLQAFQAVNGMPAGKLVDLVQTVLHGKRGKLVAKGALSLASAVSRLNVELAPETASSRMLDKAQREAQRRRGALIASKQLLPSAEMTRALDITRQALNKALQARRIFVVEQGGENYYPAFFCDAALSRRQLEAVSKKLGDVGGWSKLQFFSAPKGSLGGLTPLQALERGQYRRVMTAAEAFSER